MKVELGSRGNNHEAEGCLFTEQSSLHAEGTGYSKADSLAKGRVTPRRNWKKAPEAEVQCGEAGGSRPGKICGSLS